MGSFIHHEEKELLEIYKTIAHDLHTDVQALDTLLLAYEWRINIMKRILTEPVSMDDWINNDSLDGSREMEGEGTISY